MPGLTAPFLLLQTEPALSSLWNSDIDGNDTTAMTKKRLHHITSSPRDSIAGPHSLSPFSWPLIPSCRVMVADFQSRSVWGQPFHLQQQQEASADTSEYRYRVDTSCSHQPNDTDERLQQCGCPGALVIPVLVLG
jgi:hypothetical protein